MTHHILEKICLNTKNIKHTIYPPWKINFIETNIELQIFDKNQTTHKLLINSFHEIIKYITTTTKYTLTLLKQSFISGSPLHITL